MKMLPMGTHQQQGPTSVTVYKEDIIVGHPPFNLALILSAFLWRDVNKAFAKVAEEKVNRGAGYGLEIPEFAYQLYGPGAG
jgi:hypothetical protein